MQSNWDKRFRKWIRFCEIKQIERIEKKLVKTNKTDPIPLNQDTNLKNHYSIHILCANSRHRGRLVMKSKHCVVERLH